jgi:hypothetical protein
VRAVGVIRRGRHARAVLCVGYTVAQVHILGFLMARPQWVRVVYSKTYKEGGKLKRLNRAGQIERLDIALYDIYLLQVK